MTNDFSSGAVSPGYPLSQQQRAALGDAPLAREPAVWVATLDGPRHDVHLREACFEVVARHEILRTAFVAVGGYTSLRQQPLADPLVEWKIADGGGAPMDEAVAALLAAECAQPFEPAAGRTLRVVLLSIDAARAALVWIASHLVADAGSLASLHDAVLDGYAARRGEPVQTATGDDEGVLDYGQYVEWREELGQSDDAPAGKAYWAAQAAPDADRQTAVALPYRRQPAGAVARVLPSRRVRRTLDGARAVVALADRLGTSIEVVAQAAWWTLIGRIAQATRVSGHWQNDCRRDYGELAGAIGPFEAVLPVAVDVRPERTFRAVAGALAATLDAHREVQEYWASPGASGAAQGGIAFRFGSAPEVRHAGGLTSTPFEWTMAAASFDLALGVDADRDGAPRALVLHHAPDRYSADAAETLLDQYATWLGAFAGTAGALDVPLASLSPVGPAERTRLLGWQGAAADFGPRTVSERVRDFATTQPDAPALAAPDLSLSYGELERCVSAAAVRLAAAGASRERPVAIALPRSGGLVVALLAAMRAGAPYLPLDPEWPEERRARILEQAQPAVKIVDAAPAGDRAAPAAIGIADLLASPAVAGSAASMVSLDGPAYLLFTSGSTGVPKGVPIGQRQLLNYALAVGDALGFDASQRFALTSTVAADLGNTTLFGALAHGACLVVATAGDMRDGDAFARFVREQAIDVVKMVPSHLDALLDTREPALPATVVLGGEAASEALLSRIARIAPATRIVNHYGPTETTVGVAVHVFERAASDAGRYASGLPLSAPLANCRLRVLDAGLDLVPAGAAGELYVGGAQLCDGYLGNARSEAFVDDPFVPGERLYRTGDLARIEPEGGVRIVGRADDQVKVRGFRIELGDVEAALLRLPQVRQAAVRMAPRGSDHELAAYVVASDATATADTLKAALREHVPDAMVPARIVLLAALPRLPNGKIDRQALLDVAAEAHTAPSRAPGTALETLLAQTAAALLERESIGVDDDFFALGGHSLLVIRFVTRVQDLLRVELLPGTVFEHPSIASLAGVLLAKEAEPGKLEKVAALRLKLAAMTPDAREALLAKARDAAVS
ncbi:MAG: amino acid adenylation domain-containing protein [Burkholderia gladioli]